MEAKELRICNLISLDDKPCTVKAIPCDGFLQCEWEDKKWVWGEPLEDFKPIPLTEQWLIDLGFVNDNTAEWIYRKGDLMVNIGNHWTWHYMFKTIRDINHVHQLQNLYFALTGTELKTITK